MSSNKIISTDLILPRLEARTWQEVIQALGDKLQDYGYVKATYVPAVMEREGVFPTGLPLGDINVAIPHTDVEHVNKPAIAVATLARPVAFGNMGEPGNLLEARIVFLLAMNEPHAQLDLLQNLVKTFQNPQVLENLLGTASPEEIESILQQHLLVKEAV
jgi:PTS system galactitol-specific IIA component